MGCQIRQFLKAALIKGYLLEMLPKRFVTWLFKRFNLGEI